MLQDTRRSGNTWLAIVFDHPVPPPGAPGKWSYNLRFNRSAMPPTTELHNRFALGLDNRFKRYYLSGFLSVQVPSASRPLRWGIRRRGGRAQGQRERRPRRGAAKERRDLGEGRPTPLNRHGDPPPHPSIHFEHTDRASTR